MGLPKHNIPDLSKPVKCMFDIQGSHFLDHPKFPTFVRLIPG